MSRIDADTIRRLKDAPRETLSPSDKALQSIIRAALKLEPLADPAKADEPTLMRTAPAITHEAHKDRAYASSIRLPDSKATLSMYMQRVLKATLRTRVLPRADDYVASMLRLPLIASKAQGELAPLPVSVFAHPEPPTVKLRVQHPSKSNAFAPIPIAPRSSHPAPKPVDTDSAVNAYLARGGAIRHAAPKGGDATETRANAIRAAYDAMLQGTDLCVPVVPKRCEAPAKAVPAPIVNRVPARRRRGKPMKAR